MAKIHVCAKCKLPVPHARKRKGYICPKCRHPKLKTKATKQAERAQHAGLSTKK